MIKIYHPWPVPVQAACYTEPSALAGIEGWVRGLHERGLVDRDVRFEISRRAELPVGVLRDRSGDHDLLPSGFLVFTGDGLRVLDRMSFFRRYHEPA